jgi:hypothetical protein
MEKMIANVIAPIIRKLNFIVNINPKVDRRITMRLIAFILASKLIEGAGQT